MSKKTLSKTGITPEDLSDLIKKATSRYLVPAITVTVMNAEKILLQ